MAAAVAARKISFGALAEHTIAGEAREAFESAIGEYVAAVLDALGGHAHRHVVQHRFKKLLGRGELARELALLAAVLVGGDRTAVGQGGILDQHRASAGKLADDTFGPGGLAVVFLDADIEQPTLAAMFQKLGSGHARRQV